MASITFVTAIDNDLLKAAYENTDSVIVTVDPNAEIKVPAGKELTLNAKPATYSVIVAGKLTLNADDLNLSLILGEVNGQVEFTDIAAANNSGMYWGAFYNQDGTKVSANLQVTGHVFTYQQIPTGGYGFVVTGLAN